MAHLQSTQIGKPRNLSEELSFAFRRHGNGKATAIPTARRWKPRFQETKRILKVSSSTGQDLGVIEKIDGDDQISSECETADDTEFFLVEEHGWKVRSMVEEESEIRKVAEIQAEAFHQPVALFNDLFFQFFQAEVLAGLLYRLRNSPPNRYACLVATPASSSPSSAAEELVGVVDVTVQRDSDVVQHLGGAQEYLYVSGIAVGSSHRRKKVATALLKGCEAVSALWGHEYLVLRAYEDDWGARTLYNNGGYRVVSKDAPWVVLIGRRRRILMVKRLSGEVGCQDK